MNNIKRDAPEERELVYVHGLGDTRNVESQQQAPDGLETLEFRIPPPGGIGADARSVNEGSELQKYE